MIQSAAVDVLVYAELFSALFYLAGSPLVTAASGGGAGEGGGVYGLWVAWRISGARAVGT